ncbi:unnamed protein product [Chondrus crispus]|uniref:Uncharacterized protein n=1 Tax=Chondrus crispus TaxID=2769 RepID=R7Q767_CHOCR|nr:unnamed protein product [Chondrus crispus]CDF33226.1 unnamed protein product [Chondrus crispus]|eukprot:XP_005713029.1 unnamed protein product [Chondrus crispus]
MERLIASVFNDDYPNAPPDDTAQPSIRTLKRKGRSKIPSLNFSHLPPPLPFDSSSKPSGSPRPPPTPNQLMRRLSTRGGRSDSAPSGGRIPPTPPHRAARLRRGPVGLLRPSPLAPPTREVAAS